METDEVWRAIDAERSELADQLETITDADWETPSLCAGWRVRDVGAHLTLAQVGAWDATVGIIRARGDFNRMIHDTAVRRAALPTADFPALVRSMVGSRRKVPGVTPLEPLIDALVHGQDIAVPLGLTREMPPAAAAAAAQRAWSMGFPFHAQKRLHGLTLHATDAAWHVGDGPLVEGPVRPLLMLVTGRSAALEELSGPGSADLANRGVS